MNIKSSPFATNSGQESYSYGSVEVDSIAIEEKNTGE